MMQLPIAENIPLNICCIQGAHLERWPRVCSQPESRSMTWTAIIHKVAMSFWVQSTAVGSNTEIKLH
jgi:hypothetical protein